ncbi:3-hydroxyacyl-CoA dehydrogenase family protein [Celeribacter sp.]|uniref:3-hydroxyacyl-CoA dehydrogenase family protein n=1 Tax=Celeribacter sp. TaxID=1890673 RepID=UPI003A8D0FD5
MARIVVIGSGVMGIGICKHFLRNGCQVALVDPSPVALKKAKENTKKDGKEALCVRVPSDLRKEWSAADVVFEAVPEVLSIKRSVLSTIEECFGETTIIASNTSGLKTTDMTEGMHHPERFVITHFFNPADLIPAVEIVPGPATTEQVVAQVIRLLERTGKKAARLQADIPGFIANRLQHALLRECFYLIEKGVADAETIDLVTRYALGVRLALIGPMLQRDLNGLDTHLNIARYLYADLDRRETAPDALVDMVAAGHLGRKSGQGFFKWDATQNGRLEEIEALLPEVIALADRAQATEEE